CNLCPRVYAEIDGLLMLRSRGFGTQPIVINNATSQTLYGPLGVEVVVTYYFKKQSPPAADNIWDAFATTSNGTIGGTAAEGPPLEDAYRSFVGVFNVPVRHGLTAGELALFHKKSHNLDVDLRIVRIKGWRRSMSFHECGLPWVPPSPNMPSLESATHYPGTCLFEATNVSEGRGTERPFEWIGAPWIDAERFAEGLNALGLPVIVDGVPVGAVAVSGLPEQEDMELVQLGVAAITG
ncbi:MAG: DUF1343 domain-containing protein, partial [Chloroflexi bacterium]|nr:DUF1343 domain-containing protein [Chloroflexota bacterium]